MGGGGCSLKVPPSVFAALFKKTPGEYVQKHFL